jgi:uncharacterized protein YjgD (DUF1641 family)
MITLEKLKENKDQIIELIALRGQNSRTKELMTMMVKSIGCRVYEDMDVMKFAKEVIKNNPAELVISDSTAYYEAEKLKQYGSSMRNR